MNYRIKQIRQHPDINLSQEAFGKKIGVTGAAISRIESGDRNITEQNIKAICREFHVNEGWLRTGEGEMFVELSRDQEIAAFMGDVLRGESDNFKRRFIAMLAKLNESEWELLENKVMELAEGKEKKGGQQ